MLRIINNDYHSLNSSLLEVSRKNMVGKTKVQSPTRYNKRLHYHASGYDIDFEKLLASDFIVANVKVGDYICTVAYKGVLSKLADLVERSPNHYVNIQITIKALTQSIDETDVLVNCTCPDFRYRFAYWATKFDYKYGKPETRPSEITNPDDKLGAICKHLTAILANKRWMNKLASVLNKFIRENADEIRDIMGLSEDEFIVNPIRFGKIEPKKDDKSNEKKDDSEEELEPVDGGDTDGTTDKQRL
jgi:hypothetical protein